MAILVILGNGYYSVSVANPASHQVRVRNSLNDLGLDEIRHGSRCGHGDNWTC
jgi:hypothetical protein